MKLENIDKMQKLARKIEEYAQVRQALLSNLAPLNLTDSKDLKEVINTTMMEQIARIQKEISEL